MATHDDTTRFAALKDAAAAAVSSYRCGMLGVPDKPLAAAIDELETQLDVAVDTAEVLAMRRPDAARDKARAGAYDVRFLVEAAVKLNRSGADDGPLEQVLEAARAKLDALVSALDSVNFGKVGAAP